MALPDFEAGPWTFYINKGYQGASNDVAKNLIWQMKDCIAYHSQWSVVASSNTSSVSNIGAGGDVDHWDSSADIARYAWVLLENSVNGEQLLISPRSSSFYICDIYYSSTGSHNADGGLTALPTATERVELLSGQICDSTQRAMTCHSMVSSDGKSTRLFWQVVYTSSYGGMALFLEELADTPSEWTSTNKRCANFLPSWRQGSSPKTMGPIFGDIDIYNTWTCYLDDGVTEGNYTATTQWPQTFVTNRSASHISSDNIQQTDLVPGFKADPIRILRGDKEMGGGFGRIRDLYIIDGNIPNLTTFGSSGQRKWIKFGSYMLPWDETTQPLDPE